MGPGPRSPRPGAPLTFVTTDAFLDQFGLESLADLSDLDDLRAMGLADTGVLNGTLAGALVLPESVARAPLPPARRQTRLSPAAIDPTGPLTELKEKQTLSVVRSLVGWHSHSLRPSSALPAQGGTRPSSTL